VTQYPDAGSEAVDVLDILLALKDEDSYGAQAGMA
jgi:hypothetical protein